MNIYEICYPLLYVSFFMAMVSLLIGCGSSGGQSTEEEFPFLNDNGASGDEFNSGNVNAQFALDELVAGNVLVLTNTSNATTDTFTVTGSVSLSFSFAGTNISTITGSADYELSRISGNENVLRVTVTSDSETDNRFVGDVLTINLRFLSATTGTYSTSGDGEFATTTSGSFTFAE